MMQIISLVNSSSINLSPSPKIKNLKHQHFSSPVSNKISHYEIPASGFPSSPPQISGLLCRASQVAELFPTTSPEIVVREARIEDCWGVAETYCSSFFPEYSFPLDFVLWVDRLVGMLFGFSIPKGCKRTCLVAVTGSCGGASDDFKIGSLDGKISLNKGCVAGILTLDTVADFLPRKGPLRQRRTELSHMFYADDALLVGEWSKDNMDNVARVLRVFHLCSGLKINLKKSFLYGFGVDDNEVETMASIVGCRMGSLPFDYLGIRVGANMGRCCNWTPVIETVIGRLTSWKANSLSMGGRLTLIKSVLSSLPIYYLSIYKAPGKVLDKLEMLMRNFLWTGTEEFKKIHWVSWDLVTAPKKDGGLGVARLREVNIALLTKWGWRFYTETDSMWRKIVNFIHGGRELWSLLPVKKSMTGAWKSLVTALEAKQVRGNSVLLLIRGKLGCGEQIRFWYDLWFGETILKVRWPGLYKLDKEKRCKVKDRLSWDRSGLVFNSKWQRYPITVEELSEFQDLERMLLDVKMSDHRDKWVWGVGADEAFSVANCKGLLLEERDGTNASKFIWESWVPLKVNLHAWRANLDRLPTRDALVRRRINIDDDACPMCNATAENLSHLFIGCGYAFGVWTGIGKWCRLDPFFAYDYDDLMMLYKNVHGGKWRKKIIRGIVMIGSAMIWNARNAKVFQGKEFKVMEVIAEIKSKAFLWLKNRSKFKCIDWKDWAKYPLYMIV